MIGENSHVTLDAEFNLGVNVNYDSHNVEDEIIVGTRMPTIDLKNKKYHENQTNYECYNLFILFVSNRCTCSFIKVSIFHHILNLQKSTMIWDTAVKPWRLFICMILSVYVIHGDSMIVTVANRFSSFSQNDDLRSTRLILLAHWLIIRFF